MQLKPSEKAENTQLIKSSLSGDVKFMRNLKEFLHMHLISAPRKQNRKFFHLRVY